MADDEQADTAGNETENLKKNLKILSAETAYLKKYFALRKRCEQIQQSNEKLVNRIQHVKKLIKRIKRDKRFLSSKLDEYGDDYKEAQVPYMWEEALFLHGSCTHSVYMGNSDSETEGKGRAESKSAMSLIQPLLNAHGMGHQDQKAKKIKVEKEKDPNAPKKPANAFLMFCQTQRTSVQEEYYKENKEEIAHHELTKKLAHHWNALVPEEKRVYYTMYEKEKERYERELRNYKPKQEPSEIPAPGLDSTESVLESSLSSIGEESGKHV